MHAAIAYDCLGLRGRVAISSWLGYPRRVVVPGVSFPSFVVQWPRSDPLPPGTALINTPPSKRKPILNASGIAKPIWAVHRHASPCALCPRVSGDGACAWQLGIHTFKSCLFALLPRRTATGMFRRGRHFSGICACPKRNYQANVFFQLRLVIGYSDWCQHWANDDWWTTLRL